MQRPMRAHSTGRPRVLVLPQTATPHHRRRRLRRGRAPRSQPPPRVVRTRPRAGTRSLTALARRQRKRRPRPPGRSTRSATGLGLPAFISTTTGATASTPRGRSRPGRSQATTRRLPPAPNPAARRPGRSAWWPWQPGTGKGWPRSPSARGAVTGQRGSWNGSGWLSCTGPVAWAKAPLGCGYWALTMRSSVSTPP